MNEFNIRIEKISSEIEREWYKYRFVFWSVSIFLIVMFSQFIVMDPFVMESFSFQRIQFTGFALVGSVLGGTVGFHYYQKKIWWTIADVIWIMFVLVTLYNALVPVETYMRQADVARVLAQDQEEKTLVLRKIWVLEDKFCTMPGNFSSECKSLKIIEREVNLSNYKPLKDSGFAAQSAISLLAKQPTSEEVARLIEEMHRHAYIYDSNASKRNGKMEFNFFFPYSYIFLLTLALGLRMGRSGAEYRKNREEEKGKK